MKSVGRGLARVMGRDMDISSSVTASQRKPIEPRMHLPMETLLNRYASVTVVIIEYAATLHTYFLGLARTIIEIETIKAVGMIGTVREMDGQR
jgi:hypothetical protein